MSLFKVKLSNIAANSKQKAWNYLAAVPPTLAKTSYGKLVAGDKSFRAAVLDGEFFVEAELQPGEDITGEYLPDPTLKFPPHEISNWISDEPLKLLPKFVLNHTDGSIKPYESVLPIFWDGNGPEPLSYIKLESANDVRLRFYLKTMILEAPIHITGYLDVYTQQDYIPLVLNFQYGNIVYGDFEKRFSSLSMITGEKAHIDWRNRKGLHAPVWRNDISAWETELVSSRVWRKSRTIEVYGALLCMPDYSLLGKWSQTPGFSDRLEVLEARQEGPICAFVDAWEGSNLAFKVVPEKTSNWRSEDVTMLQNMYAAYNIASDEYAKRPYGQPSNSGQTGSQPDFGASKLEAVMSNKNAWAIWEYRFNAQAWKLRPYAHREVNGNRVLAANHPKAKNYNMRPDDRFNQGDRLGWNPPIPYFEDWTGSDNQHRSDNLLLGLYQITKDPSLKDVILDLIENQKMELDPTTIAPNGPVGSPRGWGRPLISLAHLYTLGFTEVLPIINKHVDYLYRFASMRFIPQSPELSVRVLFDQGSKYGWVDNQGNPIRAWVCWEEAIAAMGLWAVWTAIGNFKARDLALEISRTITKHAFFMDESTGNWHSAYCVRWDATSPGKPLPDSSYNLDPANKDVFVYGMQNWLIPCLKILTSMAAPQDPDSIRANEIMDFFGRTPQTQEQAAWWAVV